MTEGAWVFVLLFSLALSSASLLLAIIATVLRCRDIIAAKRKD